MKNINWPHTEKHLDINDLAREVIGAAINVHKALGLGFDKETYKTCLIFELEEMGVYYETDVEFPLYYKNRLVNTGLKIDLLIENSIMIDIHTLENNNEERIFYVLNHLKKCNKKLGLIFNFNSKHLRGGSIRRVING
jgi:GxxExxY protein